MLIVVGCPRSGTRFISRLLMEHGMDVGHEVWGRDGIASWHLTYEREFPHPVVHQVRDPLAVIASLFTIGAVSWTEIASVIPVRTEDPLLLRAMRTWYHWNIMARQKAAFSYRVENIAAAFPVLCRMGGFSAAFKPDFATSKQLNSRGHAKVTWDELEHADAGLANQIKGAAKGYGYDV